MFKFDEEERRTNLTLKQQVNKTTDIGLVFFNINYVLFSICLLSIDEYKFGVFGFALLLADILWIAFFLLSNNNKKNNSAKIPSS